MTAILVICALAAAYLVTHASYLWWRSGVDRLDRLSRNEPRYAFRRVPPRRRSPDVQATRVHRVLDDMPHH